MIVMIKIWLKWNHIEKLKRNSIKKNCVETQSISDSHFRDGIYLVMCELKTLLPKKVTKLCVK